MNTPMPRVAPLAYQSAFERSEEGETETTQQLLETMHKISAKVNEDEGHAFRSVHAKGHGILKATVHVLEGLPEIYAQGLFAVPAAYDAVIRFSTPPGDLLDDTVSTPRGFALKVVGVTGARVPGAEGQVTQDFLLVNGPAFNAPTAKKFSKNAKLLAATTDKAEGLKKVFSAALRGIEAVVEKAGGQSATLLSMGGHPITNLLGETYYTQVPILFGPYMAKLSIAPISQPLLAHKNEPLETSDKPDTIRDAVVEHFLSQGGEWEVRVQLCTDLEKMPIEDPSVAWPEEDSPYVAVARIHAEPQNAWSEARVKAVNDGMSFTPWHALAAHRPIGSVMRVRKAVYEMAARFRSEHNATPVLEPSTLAAFPD